MKLSKRSKYGLLASMDLASHKDPSPVPLKELAKRNNIPPKFLEQIFLTLRNSGIVHSQIGAGGGYTLGRPAKYIMLGEIIRILTARLRRSVASARSHTNPVPVRTKTLARYAR